MNLNDAERLVWLREQTGDDLRRIRESRGLSTEDVASAVGVTQSAVSRWERGERIPRGPRAVVYARLLQRLERKAA